MLRSLIAVFAVFLVSFALYGACTLGSCSSLGQIRYASNQVQYCNGSLWIDVTALTADCGAVLAISPTSQTGMNVDGGGGSSTVNGSYVTFTVTNNGLNTSSSLTTQLTNTTDFQFGTNNCSGATLAGGASCTVQIRPRASSNKSLSGTFRVNTHNVPTSSLSGTASNFAAASCTSTFIDDCFLPATASGNSAGSCSDGGGCSYSCSNGVWSLSYNSCFSSGCGGQLCL